MSKPEQIFFPLGRSTEPTSVYCTTFHGDPAEFITAKQTSCKKTQAVSYECRNNPCVTENSTKEKTNIASHVTFLTLCGLKYHRKRAKYTASC